MLDPARRALPARSQGTRILLLEDTRSDALVVIEALRKAAGARYHVEHVLTLADVQERLGYDSFDAILLDLCVSDSQGLDTFRAVRALRPDVPIIVQSGLTEKDIGASAVREGAQDYLVKGRFDDDSLVRTVRYAIERHRGERALRESEERYALAIRGANDGIWDWDLRCNRIHYSERWKQMLGLDPETVGESPKEWFDRVHPDDHDRLAAEIAAHSEGVTSHLESEYRVLHRDGTYRWALARGVAVRDAHGRAYRMAGSQTDVTSWKLAEQRLLHDALHDSLTDLPNRALCLDRIGVCLRRSRRDRSYRFALLFLDLDRFKLVNDSLGHGAGDRMLVDFAGRLRALLRPTDTVARFGGDEFCLVLDGISGVADAEQVVRRIETDLRQPFDLSGQGVFTTTSIGIALSSTTYATPEEMIRDADLAMYRAKAQGGARHEIFDARLHAQALTRLEIETDLRMALRRDEFCLHYQPIVSLESHRIKGYEALLRWYSPTRGTVMPDEFIPIAEETGLIVPIGQWVLRTAARQIRDWSAGDPNAATLTVSVNLSSRQITRSDLVNTVTDSLSESGLLPAQLVLEVTESVLLEHCDQANATLAALKAMGIQIHLDDFGTGYSSLRYLNQYPIDQLKIDRSFVKGMGERREDMEIIRAIVALGHSLGKKVVAEGIENEDQLARLRSLGCDFGQGFYFSRPEAVPAAFAVQQANA